MMGLLALSGLLLAACTPQQVEVIRTVVVTETITEEGETIEVTRVVEVPVTVEPAPEEEKPVTLSYNLGTEPPNIDPSLATDTTSVTVAGNMFMALTHQDPVTFEITPGLATEWEAGEDADGNQTWTFHMRDDIPWVNYDPLTGETTQEVDDEGNPRFVNAHDVVYGIKRVLDPNTASDYAYILYLIQNAQEVNTAAEGVTLDDVGVVALDDQTVQFTLTSPAGSFPAIASTLTGETNIGIVLGLVLAALSYFWYYGAVILLGASVGYTLGAGLMAAIGLDGFLSVVVGLIVAAVVGFGVLVLAVPAFLVVFLSAIGGAAAVVNGVLILLGRVALEDVDFGLTQGLYKEGVIAIVAWIVIAVVAMWWQLRDLADMSARLSVPREEYRIA
jgi:hypothetical protein